jgi:hypothetical protein
VVREEGLPLHGQFLVLPPYLSQASPTNANTPDAQSQHLSIHRATLDLPGDRQGRHHRHSRKATRLVLRGLEMCTEVLVPTVEI